MQTNSWRVVYELYLIIVQHDKLNALRKGCVMTSRNQNTLKLCTTTFWTLQQPDSWFSRNDLSTCVLLCEASTKNEKSSKCLWHMMPTIQLLDVHWTFRKLVQTNTFQRIETSCVRYYCVLKLLFYTPKYILHKLF